MNMKQYNDWEVTNNRFVGFLDIMGFKDLVMRNTHNNVYNIMQKISEFTRVNLEIKWNNNPDLVRSSLFSDSLVLYSKDNTHASLYSIICTIANLSHLLLSEEIPFKGALAFGEMSMDFDKSIFFGQPLIDAYLLQEEVCFYGNVIHGTAQKIIENYTLPFVEEYLVSFKKGKNTHLTITPIYLYGNKTYKYITNNEVLFNSVHRMKYATSGNIRNYIDETERYLKYLKNKYPIKEEK